MTIIDKLERADGPDREMDAEIAKAVGMCLHPNKTRTGVQSDTGFDCDDCGADSWGNRSNDGFNRRLSDSCPAYTASIDAAMTLVPEGWELHSLMRQPYGKTAVWLGRGEALGELSEWVGTEAKTRPLAVAAAALRVRSQGGE